MSRLTILALAACMAIGLFSKCASASEAEDTAQKVFETLYGGDFRRAASSRDTTPAVALAPKLFEAARSAEAQPELMALLCAKACELGALDPKGYETALGAAAFLSEKAPELAGPCQDKIIAIRQKQYDKARADEKVAAGDALVDVLVASEASKRLHKALTAARAVKSPKADGVELQVRAMAERQKAAAQATQLKAQVQADPANVKARDQLVRMLVVDLDNPGEAAKCLDDSSDPLFRKFAPAAAKPVADAPEMACMDLADWYLQLGSAAGIAGKSAMYARAKAYAERFLALHEIKDIDRTHMELALKKAQDELDKFGGGARKKINVIVITGGKIYSTPDDLMKVFDTPDFIATPLRQSVGGEAFENIDNWKYNVIVFYNAYQMITDKQQQNLLKLTDKGVGIAVLHHACLAYEKWAEYARIIGMVPEAPGAKQNVRYRVHVADPRHPITQGIQDYDLTDETFSGYRTDPLNHVLLTTSEPSSTKIIGWTRTYRNSRVFYIQNGHDNAAFSTPAYKTIVQRAVRWVGGQL
jgi:type 1 glutamine amidotransferase